MCEIGPRVKLEVAVPTMVPDKAPAEFHRRYNLATLTTTGTSAAGNGPPFLGIVKREG
jgi:hypothetical protein